MPICDSCKRIIYLCSDCKSRGCATEGCENQAFEVHEIVRVCKKCGSFHVFFEEDEKKS